MECSKIETVDAINLVLSIFVYKLTDKYIDIEDKMRQDEPSKKYL